MSREWTDDVCGDWQHPIEEITGPESDRIAGYRCDLDPHQEGRHEAHVDGVLVAQWENLATEGGVA